MFKKILNYWNFFIANVMYVTLHFCDLSVCTRWMGSGSGENHNVSWAGSGLLWYGVWGQRKGRRQRWTWDQSGHQDCKWIRQYAWTHRVLERSFSYEGVQLSPCGKNEGKISPRIQLYSNSYRYLYKYNFYATGSTKQMAKLCFSNKVCMNEWCRQVSLFS